MFGGVGVVNVESWYDKVSGKLLKQELTKDIVNLMKTQF